MSEAGRAIRSGVSGRKPEVQEPVVPLRPPTAGERIDAGLRVARSVALICALLAKCVFMLLVLYLMATVLWALVAHADTPDTPGYKLVCRLLDEGNSPDQIVSWLRNNYGGTVDGDRLIVSVAMNSYCPQYLPIPAGWRDWTGH